MKSKLSAKQKKALNVIKHCKACGRGYRDIGRLMKHIRKEHPHYPKKR